MSRVQAAIRRDEPVTGRATPLRFGEIASLWFSPCGFLGCFCYALVLQQRKPRVCRETNTAKPGTITMLLRRKSQERRMAGLRPHALPCTQRLRCELSAKEGFCWFQRPRPVMLAHWCSVRHVMTGLGLNHQRSPATTSISMEDQELEWLVWEQLVPRFDKATSRHLSHEITPHQTCERFIRPSTNKTPTPSLSSSPPPPPPPQHHPQQRPPHPPLSHAPPPPPPQAHHSPPPPPQSNSPPHQNTHAHSPP